MTTALLTPRRTERGWVIEIPIETAETFGITGESQVVIFNKGGVVSMRILSKPAPDLEKLSDEIMQKNFALYQELKRIGD